MWQGHDRVYVICGFADDGEAAGPALATDLAVVITQRSVATRRAGLVAGEAGDQVKRPRGWSSRPASDRISRINRKYARYSRRSP